MVKSYLKFEHSKTFGTIASASSNVVWTADGDVSSTGRPSGSGKAIAGANEDVLCWDVKRSELLSRWHDRNCTAEVTVVARSAADPDVCAVGYSDGSIRVWDTRLATLIISFNGHKSGVTSLAFDRSGVRLASGAQDTDLIVWDLVAEAGLFKLRGHKNQITGVHFLEPPYEKHGGEEENGVNLVNGNGYANGSPQGSGYLLTTSKDALLKIWDLDSRHCIETHVAQSDGECWSIALSPRRDSCITAGNDGELKVWSIDIKGLAVASTELGEDPERRFLREQGILRRYGPDRTLSVSFSPVGGYIAAHGAEKAVEIWRVRSEPELQRHMARKRRRRREKDVKMNSESVNGASEKHEDDGAVEISDATIPYVILRTAGKVRSFDWSSFRSGKSLQLLVSTTNNLLEVYDIVRKKEKAADPSEPPDYTRASAVEIPGHRTDIRSVALSSDDTMLASASNGGLKIWNIKTQNCIRSLECGYALCSSFLPGDKIVITGLRTGELEIFDIASSSSIDKFKAHDGPIWALHVHPDGKSVVTGSADKSAKFWSFEVVQVEIPGTRRTTPRLKLVHRRTLKVSDDIQSLRFAPDARLLAVALLDSTVKVYFVDSLKLFLNLYGHKLPVLDMDIAYDSRLIVTCSADKNVRIWGLDFGDCHKAFFAHQDSVMQVAFMTNNQEGNGHHFFSASKDGMIKYWDGDKFEQIQKLSGHHGEIWAIAVSRSGEFLVSASHDKSIRVWEQTDEQLFLEEEREKELEELYESTLTTTLEQDEEAGEKTEVAAAGKQTTETLMAGEKIAEALNLGMEDLELVAEWEQQRTTQPSLAPPQRNVIFMAYGNISAEQHVLNIVEKIQAASLQDALLVLPFDKVTALFTFLRIWVEKQWSTPLACRILFFMLKTHHRQIVASKTMQPMLDGIRSSLRMALQSQKDEMGLNMAALKFLGGQVLEKSRNDFVDEELWEQEEKKGKGGKKRAFINIA